MTEWLVSRVKSECCGEHWHCMIGWGHCHGEYGETQQHKVNVCGRRDEWGGLWCVEPGEELRFRNSLRRANREVSLRGFWDQRRMWTTPSIFWGPGGYRMVVYFICSLLINNNLCAETETLPAGQGCELTVKYLENLWAASYTTHGL